jgi:hypothetical protein
LGRIITRWATPHACASDSICATASGLPAPLTSSTALGARASTCFHSATSERWSPLVFSAMRLKARKTTSSARRPSSARVLARSSSLRWFSSVSTPLGSTSKRGWAMAGKDSRQLSQTRW